MSDNKNFLSEIDRLKKEFNVTNAMISDAFKQSISSDYHHDIVKISESHKQLVGKCYQHILSPRDGVFPKMKRFVKVLSHQSNSEYEVECLEFFEHPTYWFEYNSMTSGKPGDYYLGSFDFSSFEVYSEYISDIELLKEITEEEFNAHAIQYVQEMLKMPWIAEHYRFGNKMPGEEGWGNNEVN